MQAIGYKEFLAALDGTITMAEATAQVQQSSRHYAKRQLTWFRRNPAIHWLRRSSTVGSEEIIQAARQILKESDK
jgi:tRNA dimethylallyltransferase